jgi:hypothetical protein
MATELVNDGLDTKHEEFVSKVEAEIQVLLAWAIVQDGIHKGHDSCLEIHLISVDPRTAIQIIHNALSKFKLQLYIMVFMSIGTEHMHVKLPT